MIETYGKNLETKRSSEPPAASLRGRSGYRLGPRAVARRADPGLRLTSSSRADLRWQEEQASGPRKHGPGGLNTQFNLCGKNLFFLSSSTLNWIRFSFLNHKTGYLDSSNFRNRETSFERFQGDVAAVFSFSFIFILTKSLKNHIKSQK